VSLLRETSPGDTVGVTRLDRFARSTRDPLNLLKESIGCRWCVRR
jgi:DNA invertase Pin-like site-specific DNA recombinase